MIMYECLTRKMPWEGLTVCQIVTKVLVKDERPPCDETMNKDIVGLRRGDAMHTLHSCISPHNPSCTIHDNSDAPAIRLLLKPPRRFKEQKLFFIVNLF